MLHHQTIHFPIALILIGAVFELAARLIGRDSIEHLARVFLWLGVASLVVAVAAGLWVADNFGDARIPTHRNWGLGALAAGVVALSFDLAQRRWGALAWGRTLAYVAAAALIAITGNLGGEMGHGEDAPPPSETRAAPRAATPGDGTISLPPPGRVPARRRAHDDAIVLPPPARLPRRMPPRRRATQPTPDAEGP